MGWELLNRSCANSETALTPRWAVTALMSRSHPLHLLFLQIVLHTCEWLKRTAARVPRAAIRTTKLVLSLARGLVICTGKGHTPEDAH